MQINNPESGLEKKKKPFVWLHGNNRKTNVRRKRQPLDSVVRPQGSVVHPSEQPQHDQGTNNMWT